MTAPKPGNKFRYWDLNPDMSNSNLYLFLLQQLPVPHSLGTVFCSCFCVLRAKALHPQSYNGLSGTLLADEGFRYSTTIFGTETNRWGKKKAAWALENDSERLVR